ncbi:MAG: sugar transferase [Deltaproteobacteria bacterium]|nr:sugar transferase [Deltaproteobacteria bacterium]MBW2046724.1 sugar transferase [Deltaproteobacteria bacterium]MBW2301882.1 sugar transferase [Deltaproteobacteria bacterium]
MKRIFDLALSIPAFFLLSPLMLIIALLVRFKIGSPALFRQVRPGKGRHFSGDRVTVCLVLARLRDVFLPNKAKSWESSV